MVVKACKKDLAVIKNIESEYIEEAYLILKPSPVAATSGDIVKEANFLIQAYEKPLKRKKRRFSLPSFLLGMAVAGAAFALLYCI